MADWKVGESQYCETPTSALDYSLPDFFYMREKYANDGAGEGRK